MIVPDGCSDMHCGHYNTPGHERINRHQACAHEANKGHSTTDVRDEKVGALSSALTASSPRTVRPPSAYTENRSNALQYAGSGTSSL